MRGGPAILYSHIFVTKIFIYLFGRVISYIYIYIYKFQSLYLHTTLGGTARWYKYDTMHQCSTRISIQNPEICKRLGLFMQGRGGVIFFATELYMLITGVSLLSMSLPIRNNHCPLSDLTITSFYCLDSNAEESRTTLVSIRLLRDALFHKFSEHTTRLTTDMV